MPWTFPLSALLTKPSSMFRAGYVRYYIALKTIDGFKLMSLDQSLTTTDVSASEGDSLLFR